MTLSLKIKKRKKLREKLRNKEVRAHQVLQKDKKENTRR